MNNIQVSGAGIVGEIPWGTHFCQFYETNKERMDVAIPYFKAGLENNELCMRVEKLLVVSEELARFNCAIIDWGVDY